MLGPERILFYLTMANTRLLKTPCPIVKPVSDRTLQHPSGLYPIANRANPLRDVPFANEHPRQRVRDACVAPGKGAGRVLVE